MEYHSRICSMKNYLAAWENESGSCDHKVAMSNCHAAQAKARKEPVTHHATIAHSLLIIHESEKRMRQKWQQACSVAGLKVDKP